MPVGQPLRLCCWVSQTHGETATRFRNDAQQNLCEEQFLKSALKLEKTGPAFLSPQAWTRKGLWHWKMMITRSFSCADLCLDPSFPASPALLFSNLISDFPSEVICIFNDFSWCEDAAAPWIPQDLVRFVPLFVYKASLNVRCEASAFGQKGSAITQVSAQAQLNLAQEDCLAGWTDALESLSDTRSL